MNCPKCSSSMTKGDTDSRQEWCREIYYCSECDKDYSLLTTYQPQSSLVETQEWEKDETNESKEKSKKRRTIIKKALISQIITALWDTASPSEVFLVSDILLKTKYTIVTHLLKDK